ncbi:MAG: hypothetical protein ACRYGP_03345 [Janthinobacterium lividum]
MTVFATMPDKARNDSGVLDLAELSTHEGFMHRVFRKAPTEDPQHTAASPTVTSLDDYDKTSALIDEACQAIGSLSARCEILDIELDRERLACAEHEASIDALKSMVLELRAKNAVAEAEIKAVTLRCEAAEARNGELAQHQRVVTLRASKAETLSNRLQQQVEAAFGQGSPIRSVMESVGLQQAAE